MRPCCVVLCLLLSVAPLCRPVPVHGLVGDKPSKLFVRFLATSTVVHSAWSGNQDIYLVELKNNAQGTPFLAKRVDGYPGYGSAIPRRLLVSDEPSPLEVRRDPECDVWYADMPKRAAPGDRMAVYPAPMTFVPSINPSVAGDFMVPSFRFVRQ